MSKPRMDVPEIPDEVVFSDLHPEARARLRTLSKENAEDVGRHLVMAGHLLDRDPELAYQHAQVALARGGRVDVVREAVALTAYATGRYAEALRELRTVRRLAGGNEHLALMADCERGLGRPDRALALAQSPEASTLDPEPRAELQMVMAGARLDMGEASAALLILTRIDAPNDAIVARVAEAKIDVLRALGRHDEAAAIEESLPEPPDEDDVTDAVVYDVEELPEIDDESEDGAGDLDGEANEESDAGEPDGSGR